MSDFTIRSESVDVEQIMKQIRQRILEKRGADYTEDQIRELASVRLEKFLDPKQLRSDLLDQFRKSRPAPVTEPPAITPPFTPDEADIFATHRGALRFLRKLFSPLMKMMFNPNPLLHVIHKQADFNVMLLKREARRKIEFDRSRAEWNALYYEVLHNLVLETTRMGIEVQNLRMKVESLSSRLDFSERRVRALEGVVQYRPEAVRGSERRDDDYASATAATSATGAAGATAAPGGIEGFVPGSGQPAQGEGRRRRRRRRGRRGGQGPGGLGIAAQTNQQGQSQPMGPDNGESFETSEPDGPDDDGPEEMEAEGGFEIPEPLESRAFDDEPEAPQALEAPEAPEALDAPEAQASEERQAPETPQAPDSDDDLQ